jgi:peptide deformylase
MAARLRAGEGMIREILKTGDPRLLRVAKPVEDIHDPALRAIIADMYETMRAAKGVGLAAPQAMDLTKTDVLVLRADSRSRE